MKRTEVISSQINSVGYDPATETLEVQFLNDSSVWQYSPVSQSLYDAMMFADSVGAYFYQNVRRNADITATRVQ